MGIYGSRIYWRTIPIQTLHNFHDENTLFRTPTRTISISITKIIMEQSLHDDLLDFHAPVAGEFPNPLILGRVIQYDAHDDKHGQTQPDCNRGGLADGREMPMFYRMDDWICRRDPEIMGGELCFTGTRVPVENPFAYLRAGRSLDQFLMGFPSVERKQADALLEQSLRSALALKSA